MPTKNKSKHKQTFGTNEALFVPDGLDSDEHLALSIEADSGVASTWLTKCEAKLLVEKLNYIFEL
jgi:hypothetical protein